MIELKPYLVGLLKALEEDYQVEGIKFEETNNGYRLFFKEELDDENKNDEGQRGEWKRDVEIYVSLGEKEFESWGYSKWQGICSCDNCEKEEINDKDKIAPSPSS